jgi:hypothetical protein
MVARIRFITGMPPSFPLDRVSDSPPPEVEMTMVP